VLDVVAAKDVVTALYESLPVPSFPAAAPEGEESKGGEATAESPPSPKKDPSAAPPAAALAEVWHELEGLLNCLIPATTETEMSEAAAVAASSASGRVAKDVKGRPPSDKNRDREAEADKKSEKKKEGGEAEGKSSGKGHFKEVSSSSKPSSSAASSKAKAPTPTAGNAAARKAPKRGAACSPVSKNADPCQFLNGSIKCTCEHGPAQPGRRAPVHPMHDEAAPARQLHHFPPAELEMIHVNSGYGPGDDGREGRYPERGVLCYRNGSAAGLGHQSKETMKFP
jgi:hypothetical protein